MYDTETVRCRLSYMTAPGMVSYYGKNLNEILKEVSNKTGIPAEALKSKNRQREIVDARFIYCRRAREITKSSFDKIGSLINRDHATVLHGVREAQNTKQVIDLYEKYYGKKPINLLY